MRNVSLMKLTGVVMLAALASTAMNASAMNDEATLEKVSTKVATTTVVSAKDVVDHGALFQPLDADKDGLISMAELGDTDSALLKQEFTKIDTNADNGISEQELKTYLEKVEVKVNI